MARTIKTVKATGGDYTSLNAALAAVPNCTGITPDTINGKPIAYEIQVYASAKNDPTMAVAIYGTLDSGHWLRIVAPAGERHAGFWDTNFWYLDCPTASYYGLQVAMDYVMVEGLQINASGTSGIGLYLGGNCLILDTIAKGAGRPCNITGGVIDLNNTILDGGATYNQQTGGTITFENCTIVRNGAYGWVNNGGSCAMKNGYVGGSTTADVLGTITATTCKSSDGSLGTTAAFSTANFVSVTPGATGYLKPLVGGALEDVGTNLGSDGSWWLGDVDIAGVARTTWDIGAHESGTGGGGGGTTEYPTGRIVTANAFRLLTAPTDIWGGVGDPAPTAGGVGDAYFRDDGGLLVKTASGWVTYVPVWKRTGTLLEPFTAGDSLAVPGTLGVTGVGTFATHVNPLTNYVSNLGALAKKFLALHAAELWVETLVAQNTLATIGGRILVGPTNPLTVDLAAATTTITVKYNNFANGDRVYLEANGAVEWMAITSAAGGSAGAYTYSVTRNLDGSGANDWAAGDAVFSTGQTGAGYIDLYSVRSLRSASHLGPTIVGNVRTGTTYSDLVERWAIGNLDGLFGYSGATYGAAFGDPSAAWVKIDPTNGIRIGHNATTKIALTAAGVAQVIGLEALSAILGSGGYIRQGQTAFDSGTGFWLGDDGGTPKFSLGVSTGKKVTWNGTTFIIVAPEITLGQATALWAADATLKFKVGDTLGNGTGDYFGISGYSFVDHRRVSVLNVMRLADEDPEAYDAVVELKSQAWDSVTHAAAPAAKAILYSGKAASDELSGAPTSSTPDRGWLLLDTTEVWSNDRARFGKQIAAAYPVFAGLQTYTISADQNDFSISADKYLLKVTNTSGAARYFNGFSAAAATPEDGRILVISNANGSSSYIFINHDNAGSTAAYRIYTRRQAALEIRQNESVTLRYDAADSRWVTIG